MTALPFVHLIMGLQALSSVALAGLVWWDYIAARCARPAPNPRRRLRGVGARLYRNDGWSGRSDGRRCAPPPAPVLKVGRDIHICALETILPRLARKAVGIETLVAARICRFGRRRAGAEIGFT